MNETPNSGVKSKLGRYVTFAKFENLYGTVDEMYKNGSKQSFMTLNVQFMISQMIAILKETSGGFTDVHDDIKKQIERHAKSFYIHYGNKEFYLIENQIGFLYCLMTLISKNMIKPSTGYEILVALSFIDNTNSFKIRENVLDSLKSENKIVNNRPVTDSSNLFAPDVNAFNALRSVIQQTPRVLKPIDKDKTDIPATQKAVHPMLNRIILRQTPFDGSFDAYYKTISNTPEEKVAIKSGSDAPKTPKHDNPVLVIKKRESGSLTLPNEKEGVEVKKSREQNKSTDTKTITKKEEDNK